MSMQLRSMALASLEAFVDHMKTYAGGNDFGDGDYRDGEYIIISMFNLRQGTLLSFTKK